MENRLHQRRVSFSDPHSPKHHGSSGSRNDKAWNWLPRITSHDDYVRDDEYVTSVAATAFAIHSLEEAELRNLQKMRAHSKSSRPQSMRREENDIPKRPSYGETSIKRSFGQDPRTKETAFSVRRPSGITPPTSMPVSPALGYQRQQQGIPLQHKNAKTRPETWEKAMIKMIQKRYEKMKSKILSCEFVKMIQAKSPCGRGRRFSSTFGVLLYFKFVNIISLVPSTESNGNAKYQNKIAREDMRAQGARAGLEDGRRKESEARKKSNKNRKTSKDLVKCLCFNS